MNDFIKPIRRHPDKLVIHVGTNEFEVRDNPEFANKVKQTNVALKLKCEENNCSFMDNSNINSLNFNRQGLHLAHEGSAVLQANIANILTSQD